MSEKSLEGMSHDEYTLKQLATLRVDLENKKAHKGDDSDGRVDWTVQHFIAILALNAIYVGSQIPLYFVSASLTFIAADLDDQTQNSWLPIAHTLAIAAVAPFCGYLQDIFGRRNICIAGSLSIMVGIVLTATAHSFGQAVTGMALSGVGAAVCELTALAGIAELVPVHKRGVYLAWNTIMIIPFTPAVMYSQLLSTYHTWRWGLWICLIWNAAAFIVMVFTYFPHSHPRAAGMSRLDVLKKIDYPGAALSVVGLTLFLVAIQAGGYAHPWTSAYVLCQLFIGSALIVAFVLWEWKGAKYPMIPRELFDGQRIIAMVFCIAFIGGINFYSIVNFFPLTFSHVYYPDPVQVGLKALGPGICLAVGATITNMMYSILKGRGKELLLFNGVLMTAFGGALAAVNPTNPNTAIGVACIASFGIGGVLVPAAVIAMSVCPDALIATTVAISLSVRTVGGSVGFAIYYNIFIDKLKTSLPTNVEMYAYKAGLPKKELKKFVEVFIRYPPKAALIPGVTPTILKAASLGSEWAYSESLQYVWYTSIAFGVIAITLCLFLPSTSKYMTNRIAVSIRK